MKQYLLERNDDRYNKSPVGIECIGLWMLATSVMVGVTAGAGALGGAILAGTHPEDHYTAAGVATIAAVGTAVVNGIAYLGLIPCLLSEGAIPTCCISDNAINGMVNMGVTYAAQGAISALVGYWVMGGQDMTEGSVIAASSAGGAVVGGFLGYCCSRAG